MSNPTCLRGFSLNYKCLLSILIIFFITVFDPAPCISQNTTTVVAGKQYEKSSFHQWLWGKHYRKEWTTQVNVPIVMLDTLAGGLKPYEAGGGRQSKTLRLVDKNNREYVLRSIDKSFGRALPSIYQGTFVENIINDQVTIAHPYAAVTIPGMIEAAGVYHAKPRIVYVPEQPALDSFNKDFGNTLYIFEQRPDENWETAPNFGNSKKIISTENLLKDLFEDHENRVDQLAYVRARLFDMFIGDWGRHEDQWRWAKFEDGDFDLFKPVPRDRDQAYTKFDGAMLNLVLSAADLGHLQTFDYHIKDVTSYNFPARNLDRQLANEVILEDWQRIARELQGALTDEVIESSVKKMPPEVYEHSGEDIIAKLKSRRGDLVDYATKYYKFISEEVEVVGTKGRDYFEVKRINDNETSVKLFGINKEGEVKKKAYYSRVFNTNETNELRLFGLSNRDIYSIDGNVDKGILVRIIGGPEKDSIIDHSSVRGGGDKTHIYDNNENYFETSDEADMHISDNPFIHDYKYDGFRYNSKGVKPSFFFNQEDRFFVGLGYGIQTHKWRKYPFHADHEFYVRYSLDQQAPSVGYSGIVNQFVGKWNLNLAFNYDWMRWMNFFGVGNETAELYEDNNYHRFRSKDASFAFGLSRPFRNYHSIGAYGFGQMVELIDDPGRFLQNPASGVNGHADHYDPSYFGGGSLIYGYRDLNSEVLPSKGIDASAGITYTRNFSDPDKSFTNYTGSFGFYLPLAKKLVLSVRGTGATIVGDPEFYQLNWIGGNRTMRGFQRGRYYGKTSFYNNNELQYRFDIKSKLFNGKMGIIGFVDNGRVWNPGEDSKVWHTGVGGGIMIAPFNKVAIIVLYGVSKDDALLHLRLNKL